MAWNPTPHVKTLRAATHELEQILSEETGAKTLIDRSVLLYTTTEGACGYVSYGSDQERCGVARRLGDFLLDQLKENEEKAVGRHHRLKEINPDPSFDALEEEVVAKIRLMRAIVEKMPETEAKKLMVRDLVMPCVEILARFCSAIQIEADSDEDDA